MRYGRCRMHGGASLRGFAHPQYKHGLFSKYSLEGLQSRVACKARKWWRGRIRALRRMSEWQLQEEARRISRLLGAEINPAETREFLQALYRAGLNSVGVRMPPYCHETQNGLEANQDDAESKSL